MIRYLLQRHPRRKVSPCKRDFLVGRTRTPLAPARRSRRRGRSGCLRYLPAMNPARKRTVRLVVALSAAVVLASALIYTSFSAASPALTPTQLLRQAQPGRSYQLTGTVVKGSVHREGAVLRLQRRGPRRGGGDRRSPTRAPCRTRSAKVAR